MNPAVTADLGQQAAAPNAGLIAPGGGFDPVRPDEDEREMLRRTYQATLSRLAELEARNEFPMRAGDDFGGVVRATLEELASDSQERTICQTFAVRGDRHEVLGRYFAKFGHDDDNWGVGVCSVATLLGHRPSAVEINDCGRGIQAWWTGEFDIKLCSRDGGVTNSYLERVRDREVRSSLSLATTMEQAMPLSGYTRLALVRGPHVLRDGLDTGLTAPMGGRKSFKDDVPAMVKLANRLGTLKVDDDIDRALTKEEKKAVKRAVVKSMGAAGRKAANYMGVPQLARPAERAMQYGGALASRLLGLGIVYSDSHRHNFSSVKVNSIIKGNPGPNASYGPSNTMYTGREKVATIDSNALTATSYYIYSFPIQPGLQYYYRSTGLVAAAFSEWCPMGIVFEYVSAFGPLSQGLEGTVTMGVLTNPNMSVPSTPDGMQVLDGLMEFKLDQNALYAVECDPKSRLRQCYGTRSGTLTSGTLTDYDHGTLVVCVETPGLTDPGQRDAMLGKLYVSWKCQFLKRYTNPIRPGSARIVRTGVASSTPLGTTGALSICSGSLSGLTVNSSGNTLYFSGVPEGTTLKVWILWYQTSATSWTAPTPTLTNGTNNTVFNNSSSGSYYFPLSGETASKYAYASCPTISCKFNQTATLALGSATFGGTIPFVEIHADAIGYGLNVGTSL